MGVIDGRHEACIEFAKILGFDPNKTKGIELRLYANEIVTVKAEIYPDKDQLRLIGTILKKFKLVEI